MIVPGGLYVTYSYVTPCLNLTIHSPSKPRFRLHEVRSELKADQLRTGFMFIVYLGFNSLFAQSIIADVVRKLIPSPLLADVTLL